MASVVAARLNAEAPEFYPISKLQKPQSHCYLFSTPPLPYFYFYPTASKHPFYSTSFSFHFYPPANHQPTFPTFESELKPTLFHNDLENHEQDLEPFIEGGDSNHAFNEVISGGGMEHRPSPGFRSRGNFVWRRKEARKDDEHVEQKVKKVNENPLMIKNLHRHAKHIRDYHHKKNSRGGFPLVPVQENGEETTVMIKNIPSKYSREKLLAFLEDHCMIENATDQANYGEDSTSAFDFIYLPIDFRTELNKGYAFVNFTKHEAAWKFLQTASGKNWELFHSNKIRHVVAARIQGKEKLENHFGSMVFPCASEKVLPLCFSPPRDGVTKGNQRTLGKLLY